METNMAHMMTVVGIGLLIDYLNVPCDEGIKEGE